MKDISKSEFIKLAKTMNCSQIAKHFGIAHGTAQKLAKRLGVELVKYKTKGRPPIKIKD